MDALDSLDFRDDLAEQSLIGAALTDPRITALVKLPGSEFGQGFYGRVWDAIRATHTAGETPDPTTVGKRLPAEMHRQLGPLLVDCIGIGIPANAEHYARIVTDRATRRRMHIVMTQLQQRLYDLDTPVEDIAAIAERDLIGTTGIERATERTMTLDEFVDQPIPDHEWVIPDPLARGARLVLTGVEGFGKSMLLRQMSVAVAAGLDPFSLRPTEARKVLYVDCENPVGIMARKLGDIRRVVKGMGRTVGQQMWIQRYPQGMDLAQPRDRLELHHLCTAFRPDLLVIGPAYKLYVGGAGAREEDLARQVTSTLDGLREEFGFALLLEHHSPHASPGVDQRTVRPIGSSLWLRWPEFGFGLRPYEDPDLRKERQRRGLPLAPEDRAVDYVSWRGAREERPWPSRLVAGGEGALPWVDPKQMHR